MYPFCITKITTINNRNNRIKWSFLIMCVSTVQYTCIELYNWFPLSSNKLPPCPGIAFAKSSILFNYQWHVFGDNQVQGVLLDDSLWLTQLVSCWCCISLQPCCEVCEVQVNTSSVWELCRKNLKCYWKSLFAWIGSSQRDLKLVVTLGVNFIYKDQVSWKEIYGVYSMHIENYLKNCFSLELKQVWGL